LLKRPEYQIRNLAKIELGKHPSAEVIAATKKWAAALDPKEANYAHNLTEALWLHQWHDAVDLDLLGKVLRLPDANARAAATRVISYWRERVPNALALLRDRASDESPRVRLNAARAASFFPSLASVEVALAATKKPIDYYLDYTIGETLRQLRPYWRKSIGDGEKIGGGDPASLRYLLRSLSAAELLKMPSTPDVMENILGRTGIPDAARAEALAGLATARQVTRVSLLLDVLNSPAEVDTKGVGRLLVAQPAADLLAHRAALMKLAQADAAEGRSYAWAAIAMGDHTLDRAWTESLSSPLYQAGLIGGLPLIPDNALRASAFDRVMAILAQSVTDIQGPDFVVASIQRDAIRTAVSTRRDPEKVFAALNAMIARGDQVPTAAQGIRGLPRTTWTPEAAAPAATALVAWAAKAHPSERTGREYIETIQIADDLAGTLPAAEAAALRAKLSGLRVPVFVIRTVHEQMRYDTPRIVVQAGRAFEIIFENPDVMPHNLVVVEPGARQKVGTSAQELPAGHTDRQGRAWVGEDKEIIAATRLLEPTQTETLKMAAIRTEGVYEYLCTFPGHWAVMFGQIVVTKDVDAYLKANPITPAAATPAMTEHKH
jgi:azurin